MSSSKDAGVFRTHAAWRAQKRLVRRWIAGWRRVEDLQTKEAQRMTYRERYLRLATLAQLAQYLETPQLAAEREIERQRVQARWKKLKRLYVHA